MQSEITRPGRSATQRKSRKQRKANGRVVGGTPFSLKIAPVSAAEYRFVYTENLLLSSADAPTGGYWTMVLNNLHDPNFSGTGYQPIGFDQMTQLWSNYRVLSVKARVEFIPVTTPHTLGLYPAPQSTLPADPNAWFVQPFGKKSPSSSTNSVVLELTVRPEQVYGITRANYLAENDYVSPSLSAPARPLYLHIVGKAFGAATGVSARVYLEYSVLASAPVSLGMS